MSTNRAMLTEILVATADPEGVAQFSETASGSWVWGIQQSLHRQGTKVQECGGSAPRSGGHSDTGSSRSKPKNLLKSQQQQGKTNEMRQDGEILGSCFPTPIPTSFSCQPGQTPLPAPEQAYLGRRKAQLCWRRGKQPLTDHGGAPSQGSLGPLEEIISRCHSLLWHLEAGVDVDPSGNHHPAVGLDGFHSPWHDQVLPYLPGERGLEEQVRPSQVSSL